MSAPAIVCSDVRQRFGSTPALTIDHLSFGRGMTAILGPNGSGKSTLLRLLATVAQPTAGGVLVDGLTTADDVARASVRRRLGYVPQTNGLPGRMRVGEYLDYVGALKEIGPARLRRQWARWALARVALTETGGDRIRSLSGGMQRRLTIAQALLGGPDLLVLDEPLTSLDAEHRADMTRMLVESATSTTVVVATHHADELAAVSHRVVVLDRGEVAFDGQPGQLASRAAPHVWESEMPDPSAVCRAVGPDRYRCVGAHRPPGAAPVEPSVGDGYVAVVRFGSR